MTAIACPIPMQMFAPGVYATNQILCGYPLELEIEGPDYSVGIMGAILIGVSGTCPHVWALNMCIAEMDSVAFVESEWGKALWTAEQDVSRREWNAYAQQLAEENQDADLEIP